MSEDIERGSGSFLDPEGKQTGITDLDAQRVRDTRRALMAYHKGASMPKCLWCGARPYHVDEVEFRRTTGEKYEAEFWAVWSCGTQVKGSMSDLWMGRMCLLRQTQRAMDPHEQALRVLAKIFQEAEERQERDA